MAILQNYFNCLSLQCSCSCCLVRHSLLNSSLLPCLCGLYWQVFQSLGPDMVIPYRELEEVSVLGRGRFATVHRMKWHHQDKHRVGFSYDCITVTSVSLSNVLKAVYQHVYLRLTVCCCHITVTSLSLICHSNTSVTYPNLNADAHG